MLLFIGILKSSNQSNHNFNTSHVTVYHDKLKNTIQQVIFQYISCYCLSIQTVAMYYNRIYFNTSHVTVYPCNKTPTASEASFQYISCYCLSLKMNLESQLQLNFNTSHVTVYPYKCFFGNVWYIISIHLMLLFISASQYVVFFAPLFQYISCYCLSCHFIICHYIRSLFQYISCYCLSAYIWNYATKEDYFNTSHVTVYLTS